MSEQAGGTGLRSKPVSRPVESARVSRAYPCHPWYAAWLGMRMRRLAILLALAAAGCQYGGVRSSWSLGKPKGEEWTILCAGLDGPDRVRQAEAFAEELRKGQGIRPADVRAVHGPRTSQLLYGTYYRQIDPDTGKLLVPDNLRSDLRLVQGGTPGQGGRFFGARAISSPTSDVGNPAWELSNSQGTYTLLVAVFENTADFYDRKAAAAAYVHELRGKGYEAWYHHGPLISEVTVGSFGPEAMVEQQRVGSRRESQNTGVGPGPELTLVTDYSADVKRLQTRENFCYQLRNMRRVSVAAPGGRQYLASQLAPVRPGDASW